MKTLYLKKQLLCACLTVAIFPAVSAFADGIMLEEVVVTATKRAESLQEVPVSVTAIHSDELEGLKLRDTTEIAAQVPNMQITAPFGDSMPVISIRGIAMDDFSLNQSSPVAIYVDEVYKGNPALQSVQMYDLERLEVLRGPQGTLYGKNSTGGAVNFITRKPGFEQTGYVTLGAGSFSRKEVKAAFETPLVDDVLAMRIAGTWTEADGWNENKFAGSADGNAIDEWGARATILYRASDELEMTLRVSGSKSNPYNYAYTPIAVNDSIGGAGVFLYESFNTVTGVGPQSSFYTADVNQLDEFEVNEDRVPKREVKNSAVSLTVVWDLSPQYTLTSISSYDDGEFNNFEGDSTPLAFFEGTYQSDVTQWAQDLRIASNLDGAFNYIAGVYWSKEEVSAPVNIAFFSDVDVDFDGAFTFNDCLESALYPGIEFFVGCSYRNDYDQERTSPAAYFDGRYNLTEVLTLRLGLRYTEDKAELKNYTADLYGTNGNVHLANIISQASLVQNRIVDREWSGKFGLDYFLKNGSLVYANYSRGYRSGAFNGQAFFDPSETTPVKPEILDAYELGFKSQLFDNRVRLNGAAFFYDYSDQQFLQVQDSGVQNLVNIDASSIMGAELELTALLTEGLTLRAGLGWLDTEIDKGFLNQGLPEENNLKGNRLIQAPEWNFNMSLSYEIPIGNLGALMFYVDTSWVDDQFYDIADQSSGLTEEGDYWLSNARVTFNAADDSYSIAAYVKNIGNERYFVQRIGLAAFGADMVGISGAPRIFGLEATYRF